MRSCISLAALFVNVTARIRLGCTHNQINASDVVECYFPKYLDAAAKNSSDMLPLERRAVGAGAGFLHDHSSQDAVPPANDYFEGL